MDFEGVARRMRFAGTLAGVVVVIAVAGIRGFVAPSAAAPIPRATKVLIVLIDTLRSDHVGSYGYGRNTSPVIDSIARDGIRFSRAYAQCNWTKPSVASIFTGLYPRHHGVVIGSAAMNQKGKIEKVERLGAYPMPDDLPVVAEAFHAGGFATVGFVENSHVNEAQGFGRGFDEYRRAVPAEVHLRKYLEQREPDAAVFAYLHLIGPHDPYDSDKDHFDRYRYRFGNRGSHIDFKHLDYKKQKGLTDDDVAQARALYDAELAYYDGDRLGAFIGWMRETGRYDDWLIVVTADHGEELHDHGSWAHGHSLYEEVVHVPLIVKLPANVPSLPAGTRLDEVVELVDLFPTLAELAGVSVADGIDGKSLVSLLRGERDVDPEAVAIVEHATHTQDQVLGAAIIGRDRKLVEAYDVENAEPLWLLGAGREALFDLAHDPRERSNLIERRPEVVASLRDELHARVGTSPKITHRASRMVELSDDETDNLRALGYIE